MRKQEMCEGRRTRVNICEGSENQDLVEDFDLDRCRRHLQISMVKRAISRAGQEQKQQGDIGFADVCCLKLLGFELFEFLLIGRI